jgi:hypothetical protein
MRFAKHIKPRWFVGAAILALAIPVIGQDSPESILPPGFGDPVEDPKPAPKPPRNSDNTPRLDVTDPSQLRPDSSVASGSRPAAIGNEADAGATATPKEGEDDALAPPPVLQDLPAAARRSTARVGVLAADDGDMGAEAYGASVGPYLSFLMRKAQAPIASRWASIALRRALLTQANTPRGITGSDFAADRALLLLRMGEADPARMLIQAVDPDQYSLWAKSVAQQTALANADPSGMCPAAEGHPLAGKDGSWMLSRAICSAFAGETSLAGALVDQARDKGKAGDIDVLLAEKVVGAASNARRSVNVQWEGVKQLSAWRFGLATATAIKIPDPLMNSVGPHVRAWRARAALLSAQDRIGDAEIAAALGCFSSAALLDHYAQVSDEAEQAGQVAPAPIDAISSAYDGPNASARSTAIQNLWAAQANGPYQTYAHMIALSRAAAMLPVSNESADTVDALVVAMMSAGLDVQAARWAKQVDEGSLAWALLAVGSPQKLASVSTSSVSGLEAGPSGKRAQFFLAGLAGLGRLPSDAVNNLAEDLEVPLGRQSAWTKAIGRAAAAKEPGTVALLGAIGLQVDRWDQISPAMLYHVISAYRRVGLEGEARMIAAEALSRS